ncbi:MAG: polysaccharide biosynthesis protein [Ruminococcus sp.]|nr:polysaccharide biosynthesis protein [Ruminococcus sp.]
MRKTYNAVKNFEQDVSSSFIKGAAILTISMVIVKVFGLLNKIILVRILTNYGIEGMASFGMGLYANAYELFVVIFTVATGGLPIAISRLVSENMTKKRYKDVRQIHNISVPFFTILGLVCFLIIVGSSVPYTYFVIKSRYAVYGMVALAPTVFFGCLASAYRGYYEGQRNMTPTAVSEIIEAVVKLVVGSLLAYGILVWGMESNAATHSFLWMHFANAEEANHTILAFSVAGAIIGISLSSMLSWLYYFLKFKLQGDGIPKEYYENSVEARQKRETFMTIIKTALPIAAGTLVMSLGSWVDSIIIQNVLLNLAQTHEHELMAQYHMFYPPDAFHGKHITIHTNLWGCYSNALTLMQLVTAVTQVFGSSAMPNVTSAWTKGDKRELRTSINTVLKMTMMFTLPMSFGLCVLAHPVMELVYGRSPEIVQIGGNVLTVMGVTTIFTAIITPICSMINGIGKVKIPMILYTLCMLVKVGTSWIFVSIPAINIQGATAGSLVSYALICIIGMFLLVKYSGVMPNFFSTTVKPLIASVCCALGALGAYHLLSHNFTATAVCLSIFVAVAVTGVIIFIGHILAGTTPVGRHFTEEKYSINRLFSALAGAAVGIGAGFLTFRLVGMLPPGFFSRISTVFAILFAVVVYGAVLLIIRTFSIEEVKFLPKGEKIAKTLEKFHLIG